MIPQILNTSGVSTSSPAVFDIFRNSFSVGMGFVVTGTVTYTVQHTFDDIVNTAPASCTWFNHDDSSLVNATSNQDGNFSFPCRAVRINQTGGAGSVKGTIIQAGLLGA